VSTGFRGELVQLFTCCAKKPGEISRLEKEQNEPIQDDEFTSNSEPCWVLITDILVNVSLRVNYMSVGADKDCFGSIRSIIAEKRKGKRSNQEGDIGKNPDQYAESIMLARDRS